MFQRILVVFEGESVCKQALAYSRELALRMDSEVSFLMLGEMGFKNHSILSSKRTAVRHLKARMSKMLNGLSAEFHKEGITVSVALRLGDPAEEFLKFLSERVPFHAVIWGSAENLPYSSSSIRYHWMGKVADALECPLLAVSSKAGVEDGGYSKKGQT